MPNRKFTEGQQGLFGAAEQVFQAIKAALQFLGFLNPQLADRVESFRNEANIVDVPENEVRKTAGHNFAKKFATAEAAKSAEAKMQGFKKSLEAMNANHTETFRQFAGYIKLSEKLMDTESGDFGKIVAENPYLANMISMVNNGPLIDAQHPGEDTVRYLQNVNPVTKKQETGPLQDLNIYMWQVAGLVDAEYERQRINDDYTPKKEADYLKKLNSEYSRILENVRDMEKWVDDNGHSVYDAYLKSPLDSMTGKNKDALLNGPTIRNSIENIKGRKRAIKNGWGMNELGVLGSLNELKFYVDLQKERALQAANQPNPAPGAAQKYEQLNEYSRKLNKFHAEAMTTSLFHPSEKLPLMERYSELLESGSAIDDGIIKGKIVQGRASVKEAMEFGGVQPVKYEYSPDVIPERVVEGEKAGHYNPIFGLNSGVMINVNLAEPIGKLNPDYYNAIAEKYDKEFGSEERNFDMDVHLDSEEYKIGPPIRTTVTEKSSELRALYSDDKETAEREKKACIDATKKYHFLAGKQMLQDRGLVKEMDWASRLVLKFADIEKGEVMTALIENPLLCTLFGHACMIDPYQREGDGVELKQWINERNLYDPFRKFYEGGLDFFDAEYSKQRLRVNSWTEPKEKRYLAKLSEAIDKMEDGFNVLKNASMDEQKDTGVLIQNYLGHMTGTDASTTQRDIRAEVTAMQWVKNGIKQGWSSDDLPLLFYTGMVEGKIEKMIIRFKLRAEEKAALKNPNPATADERDAEKLRAVEEKALRDKVTFLTEFKNNHIAKFKESLFKNKITSPSDKLAAVSKIEGFYARYKDTEQIKKGSGVDAFEGVRSAHDFFIPRLKNRCIEEIRKAKEEGRDLTSVKNREFAVANNEAEMTASLQTLRNTNFDFNAPVNAGNEDLVKQQKAQIKNLAAAYLKMKLTNGMYKDAHPEYFNPESADYSITKRKVDMYLNQYTDHIMNVMKPANAAELANILEHAGHDDYLARIREKAKSDAVKGRMDSFINGRPERKKNDPTMQQAIQNMENAKAWSPSDLYEDIVKDMKILEKMKNELADELRKKYIASNPEVVITGYKKKYDPESHKMVKDPTKPIYDVRLPEDVKVDRKKLVALTNLQGNVNERINTYLNNKKEIIRQNGGNPDNIEDAARLGANGHNRYLAMLDAKKAVMNQNRATLDFDNHGPSMLDIQMGKERNIIPADIDVAEEKARLENNIKFNMIKGTINLQKKLAAALNKELYATQMLREEFEQTGTRKESYDRARDALAVAQENLRKAQEEYDRDLQESELVGRSVLPEIKLRLQNAKTAHNTAQNNYDNVMYVRNLDSYKNYEQVKAEYEEKIAASSAKALYMMTILDYPYKGVAYQEMKKLDDKIKAAENAAKPYHEKLNRFNTKLDELNEILGRFGGRMEATGAAGEHVDERLYKVSIPENKMATYNVYSAKHPEIQGKLADFFALQGELHEERIHLGEQITPQYIEGLKQQKQAFVNKLPKMHEAIDKGYASKIAVDLMTPEDIASKARQFEQAVNDIVIDGADGPEFNNASEQFTAFKNGVLEQPPYKEEFKKGIVAESANTKLTSAGIRKVSDSILKEGIRKDYTNENKINNLSHIAGILDSDVNVREEASKLKPAVREGVIQLNAPAPAQPNGPVL